MREEERLYGNSAGHDMLGNQGRCAYCSLAAGLSSLSEKARASRHRGYKRERERKRRGGISISVVLHQNRAIDPGSVLCEVCIISHRQTNNSCFYDPCDVFAGSRGS